MNKRKNQTGSKVVNDLILYVAVAQFQTEKILERLAQRLVEVKTRKFRVRRKHARDRVMNAVDGFLGHLSVAMTRRLHRHVHMLDLPQTAQKSHHQLCRVWHDPDIRIKVVQGHQNNSAVR